MPSLPAAPPRRTDQGSNSPIFARPDPLPDLPPFPLGTYARLPFEIDRALWRARCSRLAEAIVRRLLWRQLGPCDRWHREGIATSAGRLADDLEVSSSGTARALRALLDARIIVRQPDDRGINTWRYLVTHPAAWKYPAGVTAPAISSDKGRLSAVALAGWHDTDGTDRPIAYLDPRARPAVQTARAEPAGPVDKGSDRGHFSGATPRASTSGPGKKAKTKWMIPDFYVKTENRINTGDQAGKDTLTGAIEPLADSLFPMWRDVYGPAPDGSEVCSRFAAHVGSDLESGYLFEWTVPMIRRALAWLIAHPKQAEKDRTATEAYRPGLAGWRASPELHTTAIRAEIAAEWDRHLERFLADRLVQILQGATGNSVKRSGIAGRCDDRPVADVRGYVLESDAVFPKCHDHTSPERVSADFLTLRQIGQASSAAENPGHITTGQGTRSQVSRPVHRHEDRPGQAGRPGHRSPPLETPNRTNDRIDPKWQPVELDLPPLSGLSLSRAHHDRTVYPLEIAPLERYQFRAPEPGVPPDREQRSIPNTARAGGKGREQRGQFRTGDRPFRILRGGAEPPGQLVKRIDHDRIGTGPPGPALSVVPPEPGHLATDSGQRQGPAGVKLGQVENQKPAGDRKPRRLSADLGAPPLKPDPGPAIGDPGGRSNATGGQAGRGGDEPGPSLLEIAGRLERDKTGVFVAWLLTLPDDTQTRFWKWHALPDRLRPALE